MTKLLHPLILLKNKKFLLVFIPILLIIGIFFWRGQKNSEPIKTTTAKTQTIKQTVPASGVLTGKDNVNLRFKGTGKLAFVNFEVGDAVKKGDQIAGLDTADLNITLNQAQNTLEDKQATLRKVLDDIHQYQYGNGGFGNVGSANETETQRASRVAAEQAANNAYDNVKAARLAFENNTITSPIDGIIIKSDPIPGQIVSPTDIIAQVIDDSQIYFDAEVDEGDIGQISVGQKAEVTLNTYPDKTFAGTVEQILPTTKTTTSGATVVVTRISLADTLKLIANLNGQASIITNQKPNVLTIPTESLVDDEHVYIKKGDKKYELTQIKTGVSSDTDIEILEGLKEGDEVVTNPSTVKK